MHPPPILSGAILVFWISLGFVLFIMFGYGLLTYLFSRFRPRQRVKLLPEAELPAITVVIPAYNEEDIILRKLQNTLELNYPPEKMQVLVVTEGSDDRTEEYALNKAQQDSRIRVMGGGARRGKVSAMNKAMEQVQTPVTVLTDADTFLNHMALQHLLKHFDNPKVGLVGASKKVSQSGSESDSEGLYWKYENQLKKWDSRLGNMQGAAGELLAFRTGLYTPIPTSTLLDDFMLSYFIIRQGYRVLYEPQASATETPTANWREEWKRKVRIATGGWQSIARLPDMWAFWRNPILTYQFVGHRVLRWTLLPYAFLLNMLASFYLAPIHPFYLLAAVGYLGLVVIGLWGLRVSLKDLPLLPAIFYFLMMQVAALRGGLKYLVKKPKEGVWAKTKKMR